MASKKHEKGIKVNVNGSIFQDHRFFDLVARTGNLETALGALVRAWNIGQDIWGDTRSGIPIETWQKHSLNQKIIEAGLAKEIDGTVVLAGSVEYFDWLYIRRSNGRDGGKKKAANALANSSKTTKKDVLLDQTVPSVSVSVSVSKSESKKRERDKNEFSDFESELKTNPPISAHAETGPHPLVAIWNSKRGTLPEVKTISSKRKRLLSARWKWCSDASFWEGIVTRIAASAFCCGANERGWRANFDWFLKEDSIVKVDEGFFDNRKPITAQNHKVMDEFDRQWKEEQRKKEEQRIREIEGW